MGKIRNIIKKLLGRKITEKMGSLNRKSFLKKHFLYDFQLYARDSTLLATETYDQKICDLVLCYHSMEKGFLHDNIRYRFAREKVIKMLHILQTVDLMEHRHEVHIQSSLINLCAYYELHHAAEIDISDFFPKASYDEFKKMIDNPELYPVVHCTFDQFSTISHSDFNSFSSNRSSIRSFTPQRIDDSVLEKVVRLANNAPSACNRQTASVYLLRNREYIKKILGIQGGLNEYADQVRQLLVVTVNRNYYYSVGERYQCYIDGGIYLLNLLYALQYYRIGACPAHWAMTLREDRYVQNLLCINEAEKIISLVVIGVPSDHFKVTLSLRKDAMENLHTID